jgi:plasmid stability protein
MPGLLIKDLPPDLHKKLKESAERHHRSMTKEALYLLERGLSTETFTRIQQIEPPVPIKLDFQPNDEWVYAAIREGRK